MKKKLFFVGHNVIILFRNFYEFMGISPDAKGPEIRKAYKTLALVLHPDKSTAPDAEVQFRYWYCFF